jgi:hypothetical protein
MAMAPAMVSHAKRKESDAQGNRDRPISLEGKEDHLQFRGRNSTNNTGNVQVVEKVIT